MKYAYEKIMAENKLNLNELPEDAKIGIATIKNIEKAINMQEKKGKKVSASVLSKVKAQDKWVVNELLDYIDGKEGDNGNAPIEDEEEIIDDVEGAQGNKGGSQMENINAEGIELELTNMFESKKLEYKLSEIKSVAPICYELIFKTYDDSGDNGIETTRYSLVETDEEVFTLTKK